MASKYELKAKVWQYKEYIVLVLGIAIVLGGIWLKQSPTVPFENILNETKQNKEAKETEKVVTYIGKVNENTNIIFESKSLDKTFWPGQIILEKNKKKVVLEDEVLINSAGGFSHVAYQTDNPNFIELAYSNGDMGWWLQQERYIDINKGEIALKTEINSDLGLKIKKDLEEYEIKPSITGSCGNYGQSEGKKVMIQDLLLNNIPQKIIGQDFVINCVDAVLGLPYDPQIGFKITGISGDFSKISFQLQGSRWQNAEENIVWKEEYIFDMLSRKILKFEKNIILSSINKGREIEIVKI